MRHTAGIYGGPRYTRAGLYDWWRFMEMLRHHGQLDGVQILSPKTVKLMCSDHLGAIPGAFEPSAGFGLGAGNGTIYWTGGPHNTYYFVDFEEQMCGIFFMQTEPWNHLDLMRRFLVLSHQAIQE